MCTYHYHYTLLISHHTTPHLTTQHHATPHHTYPAHKSTQHTIDAEHNIPHRYFMANRQVNLLCNQKQMLKPIEHKLGEKTHVSLIESVTVKDAIGFWLSAKIPRSLAYSIPVAATTGKSTPAIPKVVSRINLPRSSATSNDDLPLRRRILSRGQ